MSKPVSKIWQLLPHNPTAMERLSAEIGVAPVVAQLLLNRGITSGAEADRFLRAPLAGLHPPECLPGIAQAADRLHDAVRQGRRVCIYGDYDVDGTAGTAILWQALRLLNAPADYYVPHRLEEGYGLNCEALHQIARQGSQVVVTVDCGIASLAEAEEARRLGLELIITDHHEFRESLPSADVLVHPRLPGHSYPFGGLSGAGVALKLAWALCQRACGSEKVTPRFRDFLLDSVVLAALGLVADVVPLLDENRILVRFGLQRLREAPSPGLAALIEAAELKEKALLTAEDISFKLAPRLNAAGRLGSARLVIELLTSTSPQRAADLARVLENQNAQRQTIERRILDQARRMIDEIDLDSSPALVLAHPEWHPGVIGIVASRLVEMYARPTMLIALRQERVDCPVVGHGSGRSVPGLALHEALAACSAQLLSHGGHAAAAGFKVQPEQIDAFRERLVAYTSENWRSPASAARLVLDAEVPLHALTLGLLRDLDRLEPYGSENRRPLFLATDLRVVGEPTAVGNGARHLSFRVQQHRTTARAIAFNKAERRDELLSAGGRCCLVFTPKLNEWQGMRRVDLEVVDLQAGPQAVLG